MRRGMHICFWWEATRKRTSRKTKMVVDNIKMDLRHGGMDWIHLAQDRDQPRILLNMLMSLRVPKNVGKFLSSFSTGFYSIRVRLHGVS
jgi:hypothetical protein